MNSLPLVSTHLFVAAIGSHAPAAPGRECCERPVEIQERKQSLRVIPLEIMDAAQPMPPDARQAPRVLPHGRL